MIQCPPFAPSSELCEGSWRPRPLRQLWGLVAQCERAMRAMAPQWQAQTASWGEAACLFERLTSPVVWLCQLVAFRSENALPLPEPVIQLLASSVATALKAARVAGLNADFLLTCNFVRISSLWKSMTGMPLATISLLLPRMAAVSSLQGGSSTLLCAARAVDFVLVMSQSSYPELSPLLVLGSCHMATLINKTVAELLDCSVGSTTTRYEAHYAVGLLSCYAAYLSTEIAFSAGQGYRGVPPGSAALRDLLTRPLLRLLHSPLLDTLVALQHVMTRAFPDLQRTWETNEGSSVCLVHLTPASMEPDEMDSQVAMLVGHLLTNNNITIIPLSHVGGSLNTLEPCWWITLIPLEPWLNGTHHSDPPCQ